MSRLISLDPTTNTKTLFHEAGDEGFVIQSIQEGDEELLDQNKALANDAEYKFGQEMRRVAQIPLVLYMQLKREGIVDDPKRLAKWLNDPDNRYFRTTMERV